MKSLIQRHLGFLPRRPLWLAGLARRLSAGQRGVTLVEVGIGLAVTGLVGAVAVGTTGQAVEVGSTLGKDSKLSNQTRQASFSTTDDARYSQVFVPNTAAEKGTFESADFTVSPPATETVTYVLGANLAREISALRTPTQVVKTVQDIGSVANLSLNLVKGAIVTTVVVQSEVTNAERTATAVLTQAVESPGPVVTATGVLPLPVPTVLCVGQSVTISGSKTTVAGNSVVKGTVTLSGSDNVFAGDLTAGSIVFAGDLTAGSVVLAGSANTFDALWKSPSGSCGFTLSTSRFAPYDFAFTGDTDLSSVAAVWEDAQKKRLRPGVYFVDGTLTLSGSDVTGQVTLIAKRIVLSGSKGKLSARRNGVLMFATGAAPNNSIMISGSDHLFVGVVYAHLGEIAISGSGSVFDGALLTPGATGILTGSGSGANIVFNQPMFDAAAAVRQDTGE